MLVIGTSADPTRCFKSFLFGCLKQYHEFYMLKTQIFKYFEKDKKHPSGFLIIDYLSQGDPKTKKKLKKLLGANLFRARNSDSCSDAGSKFFLSDFKFFFSRGKISCRMMMICGEVSLFCSFRTEKQTFKKLSKITISGLKIFKSPPRTHLSSKSKKFW